MSLQLSAGEATATGPRAENQDALRIVTPTPALAASKGSLFALADGVSQCADGGLAARATLQALALDYYATPETWAVAQSLDRLLIAHNRWLQANGGGQPLLTTLTALVLRGRRFTLAHVGDCRAYRWHADTLELLTEDHVWEQPGMQHVLKRALGLDQHLVVDYLEGELHEGECFLLVCDGIWSVLGDHGIRSILQAEAEPTAACQALVSAAHLAGSQDNASALLVRIEQLPQSALADTLAQLDQWPLPPKLRAGQTFEGWQVESLLGESRQSLLYLVHDNQQRAWLLKTLPPPASVLRAARIPRSDPGRTAAPKRSIGSASLAGDCPAPLASIGHAAPTQYPAPRHQAGKPAVERGWRAARARFWPGVLPRPVAG